MMARHRQSSRRWPQQTLMADIFLSYAREDLERARSLAEALTSEGWDVFWDRRIPPGRTFADYIRQRIAECRALVVLWSPSAVLSEWVVEIEAAQGRARRILIPALIVEAEIPFGYGHLNAADLRAWQPGSRSLEFDELVSAIEGLAPRAPRTAPARSGEASAVSNPTDTIPPLPAPSAPPPSAGRSAPSAVTKPPSSTEARGVTPGASETAETRRPLPGAKPSFRSDAWNLPDEPLLGFVEVAAGPFLMGSDKAKDSSAGTDEFWTKAGGQGTLDLSMFYLGRYEVTVSQFQAYVASTKITPGDARSGQGPNDHPVRYVSWREAIAYCQWLEAELKQSSNTPARLRDLLERGWHVGLPSEAEWEKAARGTDGRIYPWGNELDKSRANYGGSNTKPVGSYPTGLSPYGLLDVSGNVWEWTRSLKKDYPYDPKDGREDLKATGGRVVRGGSIYNPERDVRAASRNNYDPGSRNLIVGFRVVVSRF